MIDDGELDWKIIAINADDPKAASLNDIEDVERCATCYAECIDIVHLQFGTDLKQPQSMVSHPS